MSSYQRSTKLRPDLNYKASKVRSSRKVCNERFVCKGSQPSCYFCEDCNAYQCIACESLLHENLSFAFHTRLVVPPPPEEELCQGCCEDNFADLSCEKCKLNLCYVCDLKLHGKGKPTHIRKKFNSQNMMSEDEYLACEAYVYPLPDNISNENCNEAAYLDVSSSGTILNMSDFQMETESHADEYQDCDYIAEESSKSVQVINNNGVQVVDTFAFYSDLGCKQDDCVKIVSIFGNNSDGKSFALNQLFFNGEVFKTSSLPEPCTKGVWAAYSHKSKVIAFDTEGFLSSTNGVNQIQKWLLTILAISDVVIYKSSSEHLHDHMLSFLSEESTSYLQYIQNEMEKNSLISAKPDLVIFHETKYKVPYLAGERELRARLNSHNIKVSAFDRVEYIGIQNTSGPSDFHRLEESVKTYLTKPSSETRKVSSVLNTLKEIGHMCNEESNEPNCLDTCSTCCISCRRRCSKVMNHSKENIPHESSEQCVVQEKYKNYAQYCKICYDRGLRIKVVEKPYSLSNWAITDWFSSKLYGNVLECSNCGVVHQNPSDGINTCSEIYIALPIHVWSEDDVQAEESHTAQNIIDNISFVSQTVGNFSAIMAKPLTDWAASKVAPEYWVDNSKILSCGICQKTFDILDTKHHCRICGEGFCSQCSSKFRFIPAFKGDRRVCDKCFSLDIPDLDDVDVRARTATEVVVSGLEYAAKISSYPLSFIKGAAKPSYWIPDHLIHECKVCGIVFSPDIRIHHCRVCGEGVCNQCSLARQPVPSRGWLHSVRVCKMCVTQD